MTGENLSGTADFNRGIRPITHLCHPVKTHQLPEKFLSYKINLSVGVLLFLRLDNLLNMAYGVKR